MGIYVLSFLFHLVVNEGVCEGLRNAFPPSRKHSHVAEFGVLGIGPLETVGSSYKAL
jgi:hypothetical protein